MKVFVTQGHQQGIGIEVFCKSLLMLSARELASLEFIGFQSSVSKTLQASGLPYKMGTDFLEVAHTRVQARWLSAPEFSESLSALEEGLKLCRQGGVLYTLPTSKDQFPKGLAGHTEYFRHIFKEPDLGMFFSSPGLKVLLLSDHLALKDVPQHLTENRIFQRIKLAVETLSSWKWPINRILISGLNPHAGEGGLLGHEDGRVKKAIERLTSHSSFPISGPYPGDTMLLEQKSPSDLLIYLYHDQGLGVFKGLQGFIGSNITLGMPFPRVSPDHGTSFGLYGKNIADYRGCLYSLREAISLKE